MKNKVESIKKLEKHNPDEWLLVEVTKEDASGNPIEGKLIAHSKIKGQVIEKSKTIKKDIALFYSGDIPKKRICFLFLNFSHISDFF